MNCEQCGKKEATVHLTEVINDDVTKLHLCEDCAKTKSEEMQSHFGLTDLLSGLMDLSPAIAHESDKGDDTFKCEGCGLTYYDFQKTGRLGCGKCYDAFASNLSELLRKIHGSDKHVGKRPITSNKEDANEDQEEFNRLRDELNGLVKSEEFEKAAVLRDRIKELEQKGKS